MKARQELTKTFHVDYNSEQDGMRYKGDFTIKKLGINGIAALGVRKAQRNGGMYYDEALPGRGIDSATDDLNNMLAHLELSITDAPKWWNLDEVTDTELLGVVFGEVVSFENSFLSRKSEGKKSGGNGAGSGKADVSEANTVGGPRAVVGEKVQDSLEP